MSYCPHCGQQHPPTATFCTSTGLPIGAPAAPAAATPGYAPAPAYAAPAPAYQPPPPAQYQPPPAAYAPRPAAPSVRHSYPLAIREAGFGTALGLLTKTLPYALVRFGVLVTVSVVTIIWFAVAYGGGIFFAKGVHPYVGTGWFIGCCGVYGWAWRLVIRYFLYLLKCGHIAVLTDLITKGHIDDGGKGMFAYGKDVVKSRFGEVNVLFAVDTVVSGVVRAVNRSLDFVANLLPVPGLQSLASFVKAVIYAATTYLDEAIFSYGLARGDNNPWASARDGVIYYAQNSKELLKTGVWIVILDKVLTALAWIIMLAPAFVIAWIMPRSGSGTVLTLFAFGVAALFASNIRAAFLKPLFLVMVMTQFHVVIQNQPINQEWDERLSRLTDKFRKLGENAASYIPGERAAA